MRRLSAFGCLTLILWFLAVWLLWASRSIEDHVPTGSFDGVYYSQRVTCSSPSSGSSGRPGVLPTLPVVNTSKGPVQLVYQRAACDGPHARARSLLIIDTVLVGVGVTCFAVGPFFLRRRQLTLSAS